MSIGRFAQQAKQCLEKQAELAKLNAFVSSTSNYESVLRCCLEADDREANGNRLSPIDGQLIAIKDNICTLNQPTTCASAILQGYQSPFSATVVEKLKAAGAVIAGKTNLDEFGMGSHSINSIHGSIKSAWSESERERTVGGSSGGSALAVGTEQCYAALGTDTGGSVRLPAAWTGTVGFKPSYGMVSRWGVVAYANSLDTVGVIARNINAAKQVYDQIRGHDPRDPTSLPPPSLTRIRSHIHSRPPTRPLRIGIPLEYLVHELHPTNRIAWSLTLQSLRQKGHSIYHISLPTTNSALSAYYVIAPAEASSNLAKYDGVRYGQKISSPRSSSATTADKIERQKANPLFSPTRGALFGPEVRRRILLGSYTLSSTAMDNYFIRAQKVRRLVQDDFNRVFALPHPLLPPPPHLPPRLADSDAAAASSESKSVEVDVIVTPTSLRPPPLLSELEREKEADPARQFYEDLYTVPASLAGLPAVSVPVKVAGEGKGGKGETKVGLQVIGQFGDDELVLQVGREIES
ncbi:MAG: hypothetical protein LQ338_005904 [Usnochroma carphineum]|nr:MAG: hypothetical protein LQ338_005904 [Usnochroma carphineum]